jgi:hypothetical protein
MACARSAVVLSLLCALCVSASVFQTSAIVNLTGAGGSLSNPGFGGLGLMFGASGSNGIDTVSIRTIQDIQLPQIDLQDFNLANLVFDADVGRCVGGINTPYPACWASIDGISGYGAFTNIGGGIGLVQVYMAPPLTPSPFSTFPGPLLAEAQVFSQSKLVSVRYGLGYSPGADSFSATFTLVADPPDSMTEPVPEPATGAMELIGIMVLVFIPIIKCLLSMHKPFGL